MRMSLKMFDGNDLPHESCFSNGCRLQNKIHGSGTTTLIISNEEMNRIMQIVKIIEDFNILLKGVTKSVKN